MSLIQTLKRILDPNQARLEEWDRKSRRERPKKEAAGDPPRFVCRVCGHEGVEKTYCPHCLADTMEAVPRPK
jgi:rubrerythrin